jgi:hypothetical protein
MPSAKEFREYARECMDWARTARSEKERAIFVEMAQTWLSAAARQKPRLAESIEDENVGSSTSLRGPDDGYLAKPKPESREAAVFSFRCPVGFSRQPLDAFAAEHNNLISAGIDQFLSLETL